MAAIGNEEKSVHLSFNVSSSLEVKLPQRRLKEVEAAKGIRIIMTVLSHFALPHNTVNPIKPLVQAEMC